MEESEVKIKFYRKVRKGLRKVRKGLRKVRKGFKNQTANSQN